MSLLVDVAHDEGIRLTFELGGKEVSAVVTPIKKSGKKVRLSVAAPLTVKVNKERHVAHDTNR
jgi:hypothetical protein